MALLQAGWFGHGYRPCKALEAIGVPGVRSGNYRRAFALRTAGYFSNCVDDLLRSVGFPTSAARPGSYIQPQR